MSDSEFSVSDMAIANCDFPMQFAERAIGSSCVKAFLTVILIASDFPDSDTDCFHSLDSDTDCFILFTP